VYQERALRPGRLTRSSQPWPARLILRTASIGVVSMIITYSAGSLFKP
jgi:VIT1/CCC1 family predicted Fe2+/Mn2+ transporter